MNLQELNTFAQDFQIDPKTLTFYALHETVVLEFNGGVGLPTHEEWSDNWTEEQKDHFIDKYGVHLDSEFDRWVFYT